MDFIYEMWGPEVFAERTGFTTDADTDSTTSSGRRTFTLVRRPKARGKAPVVDTSESEASMSEAEGFTLVRRPKPSMSKPQPTGNVLSSDDEDWESVRGKQTVARPSTANLPPASTYSTGPSTTSTVTARPSTPINFEDLAFDEAADDEESDNESVQSDFTIVGA